MNLPALPQEAGAIWAVAMVKNEADVLPRTLTHLLSQRVDHVLVVDNGSTDETLAVLTEFSERTGRVHVGTDSLLAYEQAEKMTFLARTAKKAGAAWVVPFDADELWFGRGGTLAEVLRSAKEPVQIARLLNAFPSAEGDGWRLDPAPHWDPKVAFRPFPGARLEMGNHAVTRPGERGESVAIVHLPWRSQEQFARKLRQGAAALAAADLAEDKGYHWRRYGTLDDAAVTAVWEDMLNGKPVEHMAWQPRGKLIPCELDSLRTWDDVQAVIDSAPRED
ncbi:glycosyltransferase family 2 protein [Dermabacteraceae bacterium P13103]